MTQPKICVVGWYFFENLYEELKKSELDIFVVSHRERDALRGLKHCVIPNVGLEYGAYNYYINNIWDEESDVFFMHDDMDVVEFDDIIYSLYKKFKKKKAGQGYVTSGPHSGVGERFFYMSSKFLKIVKKKHGGMWYDKENLGYVSRDQMPKHWPPNRYNDGGPKFTDMVKKIAIKYGFISFYNLIEERLSLYRRGSDFIKPINTSADKKKKRKAMKTQKKNRIERKKKWEEKYGLKEDNGSS